MAKCTYCGRRLQRKASFCAGCGKTVEVFQTKTPVVRPKFHGNGIGTVFSILLAIIAFLIILAPITYFWVTEGPDFGRWGEADIVRDFNMILSGRKTEYQKMMGTMQLVGLGLAIFLCLPCYIILSVTENVDEVNGMGGIGLLFPGIVSSALLLTCWFLLLLFDFTGVPRTVILILCLLLAVVWLVMMIFAATQIEGYGIILILMSLMLGFLAAAYLAAFIGAGAVIFGDLFWIIIGAVMLLGGGCNGIIVLRVY